MSSPVVATIDGVKAVVLATLSGEIYVVNAKSGRELPGWPQWVHINSPTPTAVDSSPAVAYLDGPDRPPSIIVGAGSIWRADQQGGLEAFYASGRVRFVFQTRRTFNPWARTAPDDYSDPVFATPAVGDITGTGRLDIVFGSYDHNIYALQPDGHLVPGFPVQRADTIWSSPTLADTSHTGRDDIIMGGDASGLDGCRGGWIVDYRYLVSGPKLMWQRCTAPDDLVEPHGRDSQRHGTTRRRRWDQLLLGLRQRSQQRDHRGLRRRRSERAGLAGHRARADLRLTGHRADRRPACGRLDILCPVQEGSRDRERLEWLGPSDLVPDLRCSQPSHVVSGASGPHGRLQ